jgi:transcriptional regulator with GAF, ATPase, and Fis domain
VIAFADDLETVTVYDGGQDVPRTLRDRALVQFTRERDYHIDTNLANLSDRPSFQSRVSGSSLRSTLRLGEDVIGILHFSAAQPNRYGPRDAEIARFIADIMAVALSHAKLVEESRRNTQLRARADALETLDELLRTLVGVLDVREVFDRVSQIAQQVLPHDAMVVREILQGDPPRARNYAYTGLDNLDVPVESDVTEPQLLTGGSRSCG